MNSTTPHWQGNVRRSAVPVLCQERHGRALRNIPGWYGWLGKLKAETVVDGLGNCSVIIDCQEERRKNFTALKLIPLDIRFASHNAVDRTDRLIYGS